VLAELLHLRDPQGLNQLIPPEVPAARSYTTLTQAHLVDCHPASTLSCCMCLWRSNKRKRKPSPLRTKKMASPRGPSCTYFYFRASIHQLNNGLAHQRDELKDTGTRSGLHRDCLHTSTIPTAPCRLFFAPTLALILNYCNTHTFIPKSVHFGALDE